MLGEHTLATRVKNDRWWVDGRHSTPVFKEGSTRIVYLYNNIVYKINKEDQDYNAIEYDNFVFLRRFSTIRLENKHRIYIPECVLFSAGGKDIIAMPYIPNKYTPRKGFEFTHGTIICGKDQRNLYFDIFKDNIKIKNNRRYLIDAGVDSNYRRKRS